ncbi:MULTISPECIES: Maf family protein [Yoonia]|jgi:septum formation protein|uniref:dTTP/UTP pyrophosphatase n=1 Tax=Yoonia vestfoldensis SKA53 TaxID=314232 RepID=A3V6V1_9RHOB|nr:Maf family nucleotide pyrophosphatase [Yoonia vestfoldensis]EAQ05967.1 putative Maf-like protein [Yoonia vestfoldensis SKA53]
MTTLPPDTGLKLILGSGSPRRLELLAQLGVVPDAVRPPDIDEDVRRAELPRDYVKRIAMEKLAAMVADDDTVVLCADTTVALGRRIMGKPRDAGEAAEFLYALSGRRHKVITAVAVKRGTRTWLRDVQSTVAFKQLSDAEVNAYLASGDWQGKAGGYAIQGPAGAFIPWINGSYTGIVGLPLTETAGLLTAAGYSLYKDAL